MTETASGLRGIVVADFGTGMAAALIAKFLREQGADVTRFEPAAGDPFYDVYPAYAIWHTGSRIERASGDAATREKLLARADICLIGGEDYPGLARRSDAASLQAKYPRLVVLNLEGYPAATKYAGRPATDILVQARSGLSFEHYSKRPLLMGFAPSSYGAALHGLNGLFAALLQREGNGQGQIVASSLYEGCLSWTVALWCEATKGTPASNFVMIKDPWPLIFRCADNIYVQIVLGSAGSKYKMYKILGIDDPTIAENDSGMPVPGGIAKNFFGDVELLGSHVAKFRSQELLEAIWAAGLPAEPVLAPGVCWEHPQVVHNRIIERSADGTRYVGRPVASRESPAAKRPANYHPAALSGMRVIDFGAFVAGPYSSVILADMGAEVIKVEPVTGDPNRSIFRSYTAVNRGKRCIAIDLKAPEGLRIAQQLCAGADVVTNNFRPGVSARLGIDAATLHQQKPDSIVLEASAYGATGPNAQGAGFDMCFQALCGHDWRAGGVDNPPLWNRTSMVDYAGGLLGSVSVLQHLYQRARTGAGAEIGTGLLNAALFLQQELIQRPDGQFVGAEPLNHEQSGYHPAEQFYEASDGWLAISVRGEVMARKLVEALRLQATVTLPRAQWNADTARAIASAIRHRELFELLAAFQAAGVWAEACCTNGEKEFLHDADLQRLRTLYQGAHTKFGDVRQIGPLCRLSASPPSAHGAAPLFGEHTDAIMAELGYSPEAVDDLRVRKVIQ